MYNPQLETFIRVADAGSFNKAAEQLYITPTAVIKQINLLETELDVKLFERTHRGLKLTKAGESLYKDGKHVIQYCQESVKRARQAMEEEENVIRIGTSPITPAQVLIDLWPQIHHLCPELKFQLIPFENTPENAKDILKNLGKNIDVVAGIFDDTFLKLRGCAGFEIRKLPFCCSVSAYHPLAEKEKLTVEDLYGENFFCIKRNWSSSMDRLRDDLEQNHPQIHIMDFDFYNLDIFNRCANSNDTMLSIGHMGVVHPLLKMLPVEWEHCIPYGLLHAPQPSEPVKKMFSAISKLIS